MNTELIKTQLLKHLEGGEAFLPLGEVIERFDVHQAGIRMNGLPYSAYELFYHICYAQKDILNFCKADEYITPGWPDDYWPGKQAPKDKAEWEALKKSYFNDRKELAALAENPGALTETVKHGDSQSLLRELLLVIEHTAYHTGQLVVIWRLMS